jgi:hypothetical protein
VPAAVAKKTRTWRVKPAPNRVTSTPPLTGPAFADSAVTFGAIFEVSAIGIADAACVLDDISVGSGWGDSGGCWVARMLWPTCNGRTVLATDAPPVTAVAVVSSAATPAYAANR